MVDRINVQGFVFVRGKDPKILILKRVPERSGYFQPVSGGIEEGESPVGAVVREISEETGITKLSRIVDLGYEFEYNAIKNGVPMSMKDICFAAEIEEVCPVTLSDEHEDYLWCSVEEAKIILKWEHNLIALERLIPLL